MSGCAASRSIIDVSLPTPKAQQTPMQGFATLLEVKDVRQFEPAPREPSVPSLQDASEINNPAIRSRAIARKRGGYGKALADILLPEGRTVAQVVREAATQALAEKGYAVVNEASPDFLKAVPVNIDIQQFWSWFSPGFFTVSVEFVGVLVVKGGVLAGGNEDTVRGYSIVRGMAATDSQWQEAMQNGVQDLIKKMKAKLKSPN
jgi:uncharacterized lipoprotein YajG